MRHMLVPYAGRMETHSGRCSSSTRTTASSSIPEEEIEGELSEVTESEEEVTPVGCGVEGHAITCLCDVKLDSRQRPQALPVRDGRKLCSVCHKWKLIDTEFGWVSTKGRRYSRHMCKECFNRRQNERRQNRRGLRKPMSWQKEKAPLAAAIEVMEAHPEAIALVAKYFRTEYEKAYRERIAAIEEQERQRLANFRSRPQVFSREKWESGYMDKIQGRAN